MELRIRALTECDYRKNALSVIVNGIQQNVVLEMRESPVYNDEWVEIPVVDQWGTEL